MATNQAWYVLNKDTDTINSIGEIEYNQTAQQIADNSGNGMTLEYNDATGHYYLQSANTEAATLTANEGQPTEYTVEGESFTPPTIPVDPFA